MKLPIIVSESGDLTVFENVDVLVDALEAIDVENNEYLAFDALGNRVLLGVVSKTEKILRFLPFSKKIITVKETDIQKAGELKQLICNFLSKVGDCDYDDSMDVESLIFNLKKYALNKG